MLILFTPVKIYAWSESNNFHNKTLILSFIRFDCFNPFRPEFTIVIFIHFKPQVAVAILDL